MAELSGKRQSALAAIGILETRGPLSPLPPMTRLVFRGRISTVGRVEQAFGVEPPMEPCRAATAGERAALWLGPDEWLLIAEDGAATEIMAKLEAALSPLAHALVDISHRHTGIGVSGEDAALILNAGCPLDLDLSAFPVGMCTRTVLAKAEIVLWRKAPDIFHVDAARSFTPFVWRYLERSYGDL